MTISTSSSVAIQLACDAQSSAVASAWRIGVELLVLAQRFEADDGAELELSLRLWLRTGVLAARRTAIALAAAQASWCVVYAPGFALLALLLLRTVCTQPLHHHVPQSDTVQHNQPSPSRAGFQYGTLRARSQPVHSTWPPASPAGTANAAYLAATLCAIATLSARSMLLPVGTILPPVDGHHEAGVGAATRSPSARPAPLSAARSPPSA
jgi:hypothetical protein